MSRCTAPWAMADLLPQYVLLPKLALSLLGRQSDTATVATKDADYGRQCFRRRPCPLGCNADKEKDNEYGRCDITCQLHEILELSKQLLNFRVTMLQFFSKLCPDIRCKYAMSCLRYDMRFHLTRHSIFLFCLLLNPVVQRVLKTVLGQWAALQKMLHWILARHDMRRFDRTGHSI